MKSIESFKQSRGAVAPLVAIMLILIVICVALVVDLGHVHNVKVQLQRAVDAAALAGAQELTGGSGAATNARNVAVATALANSVDQEQVVIDPDAVVNPDFKGLPIVAVQPILWDTNIINPTTGNNQTTNDRITPLNAASYDTANGLWVTAQRDVDHLFFFFTGSTLVTADAIAVAEPYNPVLPLAIISCTPTDQIAQSPGSLPGMTVCDIKTYSFQNDQEDTAAWTSLTFNVNANEVKTYMEPGEGRDRFNQVIYGRGLAPPNYGIENTAVDPAAAGPTFNLSYPGCQPNGTIIDCGLGRIAGKEIAHWDEFPVPTGLPPLTQNVQGVYEANLPFDPMTDYGANGALPRWYNMNPDTTPPTFQFDDHFARVWSQDGVLLIGSDESFDEYQARLISYRDGSIKPFGDDRFVPGALAQGADIIERYTGNAKNKILQSLQAMGKVTGNPSEIYFPNFRAVPQYAGYPKVYVFNGVAGSILDDFLDSPDVISNSNLNCRQDLDLPPDEHALVVNVPVIFAGACETWQALSLGNSNFTLSYIGMSKFLMTRAWKNPVDYDCGSNFVDVGGCDISTFDPPPGGGNLLSAVNFITPGAMEGVQLYPIPDELAAQASLLKILLVE